MKHLGSSDMFPGLLLYRCMFFFIIIILIITIAQKIFAAGGFDICKTNEGACRRAGERWGIQKPDALLSSTLGWAF